MKKSFVQFCAGFLLILFIAGCAKDETEPEDPGDPVTPSTSNFRYSVNGGATIVADSAVYYPKFTTIYSYKGGTLNTVEINLSDLIVGSYSISTVTGNQLTYESNGQTFVAKSGLVKITSNNASKLTGDFDCALTGGTLTSISGQFTDIAYR